MQHKEVALYMYIICCLLPKTYHFVEGKSVEYHPLERSSNIQKNNIPEQNKMFSRETYLGSCITSFKKNINHTHKFIQTELTRWGKIQKQI